MTWVPLLIVASLGVACMTHSNAWSQQAPEASPPPASGAGAVQKVESVPNLQPMNGIPGQSWHAIWTVLEENQGELVRAMTRPSFSPESMVSLSEFEGGKVYLDYATFDERTSVAYLLRGRLHEGEKRRTIDQFVLKRIQKPFPAELAWQMNHLWVTALLKVEHPETPPWVTDGEIYVFSASAYARGTLTGLAGNDMSDSHPLIQATKLLNEYAKAKDSKVEAGIVTSLQEVIAKGSIEIMAAQKDSPRTKFIQLFLEWKQILAKAKASGRSILIFVDGKHRAALGKLAASETRFLSMQLYDELRVLYILHESPELVAYAREKGVEVKPGNISEEDRPVWLKLLREWERYKEMGG